MYRVRKSIDIDFAHHVRGHSGPCINLHGHTWKFEVEVQAETLDAQGFVLDFGILKRGVLTPCHALLDHALAIGEDTFAEVEPELAETGRKLLASRGPAQCEESPREELSLSGARSAYPGGMKLAVFPFSPTSERFAHWLFELAAARLDDDRVRVAVGRIYETLHPVESVAEFWRP
ncbi:MAG: 6-pyruvoyl-tetrahydropterin synthase [Myxococcaceae bacterium]|nr:6-pyruvoyl-tetrahydropterin synthase [Myxococcaceae bacterium]